MNFLSDHNNFWERKEGLFVKTDLRRRIEKTRLANNNVLMTVVEAVVNAIQSIDDGERNNGNVVVRLKYSQDPLLFDEPKPVVGFEITDNGIGFVNANMDSFETLDSSHRESLGGRGVGRLQWLKVFEKVTIQSVFEESGQRFLRKFSFSVDDEVVPLGEISQTSDPVETIVSMEKPKGKYLDKFKSFSAFQVADILKEHCLHYFLREERNPEIKVYDWERVENNVGLLVKNWILKEEIESISVMGKPFELRHLTLRDSKQMEIAYFGNNRPVRIDKLKELIPELSECLILDGQQIGYLCRVGGKYLDDHVSDTRDAFDILEGQNDGQLHQEITMKDISQMVVENIRNFFASAIEEQKERAKGNVRKYVDNKNPRYRPVLDKLMDLVSISVRDNEREIEAKLNQGFRLLENENFDEGQKIIESISNNQELNEEFKIRMEAYAENTEKLKGADLAQYVWRRRTVLEILKMAIEHDAEGRFYKESVVHELLIPRRKTSKDVLFERLNLWVLDERLAFHRYLASDLELSKYPDIVSDSLDRPDICSIREFDVPFLVSEKDSMLLNEINIVEFKRPMRKGMGKSIEEFPEKQALNYLLKIRKGLAEEKGRKVEVPKEAPGRIYIVCDLVQDIVDELLIKEYRRAGPGMMFYYHGTLNVYIEFISYDYLIDIAKERNYAFFSVLNLPQF